MKKNIVEFMKNNNNVVMYPNNSKYNRLMVLNYAILELNNKYTVEYDTEVLYSSKNSVKIVNRAYSDYSENGDINYLKEGKKSILKASWETPKETIFNDFISYFELFINGKRLYLQIASNPFFEDYYTSGEKKKNNYLDEFVYFKKMFDCFAVYSDEELKGEGLKLASYLEELLKLKEA